MNSRDRSLCYSIPTKNSARMRILIDFLGLDFSCILNTIHLYHDFNFNFSSEWSLIIIICAFEISVLFLDKPVIFLRVTDFGHVHRQNSFFAWSIKFEVSRPFVIYFVIYILVAYVACVEHGN